MILIPHPITKGLVTPFRCFWLTILVLSHDLSPAFGISKTGESADNPGNGIPAPTCDLKEFPANKQDTMGSDSTERDCQGQDEVMTPKGRIQNSLGDPECEDFTIQFAPLHTFETRALVSFPRSGNTWLRHLIESSTGYFTGSVFSDKRLFKSGFLGEMRKPKDDGTTILQKTHYNSFGKMNSGMPIFGKFRRTAVKLFGPEYRGILVIRNPFNAFISYWDFKGTSQSHHKSRKDPGFDTLEWKNFVQAWPPLWADMILDWIQNSSDLLVVLYEDLILDTEKELRRILAYLKHPIDPARLKCTLKYKEGSFHRKPGKKSINGTKVVCPFKDNKFGNTTLDLIVQNSIKRVNSFLLSSNFPLQLNYTPPACDL